MLSYESPQSRDVASLENWITRTACLARDETAYLSKTQDLLSVTSLLDDSIVVLEQYCENVVIAIFKWLRRVRKDMHVPCNRQNCMLDCGTTLWK
jgi:hypothetical protein